MLVVCVLLTFSLAELSLPSIAPDHPTSAYWFAAVIGVIGFLLSLTGHELGHSYIADRNNMKVIEITLWLFGGVAKLKADADNAGAEFRIAAAGPAMSMVMAGIFGLGYWGVERADGSTVLAGLLMLAGPRDQRRARRLQPAAGLPARRRTDAAAAILWRRSGRKGSATRTAALWGQILAGVLIAASLAAMKWWSFWSGMWTLLLALFLLLAARSEWTAWRRGGVAGPRCPGSVAACPGRCPRRTPRWPTWNARCRPTPGTPIVTVYDEHGHVSSLVFPDAVMRVPPAQRSVVPITSLTEPIWSLLACIPEESVEVLARLGSGTYWRAVVTDGNSVEGVLCSEDVDRVLELATV